jgi:hypothetical protein
MGLFIRFRRIARCEAKLGVVYVHEFEHRLDFLLGG